MLRGRIGLLMLLALPVGGCGASLSSRPVKTDAELGRVIVYRSGVAYFERHARVDGDRLVLNVPAERVDDFLKSLTIRDRKTGRSLPVSFPTLVRTGDRVELAIVLPKDASRDVAITYVTESPAWKPSYRVELDGKGSAKLEAWAVVDNVSGEDWERVTVGVGSTSALSFKFDLHSVRYVERETLNEGPALALAPPTGGSPYAVAGDAVAVVGNFRLDELEHLNAQQETEPATLQAGLVQPDGARVASKHKAGGARRLALEPPKDAGGKLADLAQKLRASGERIRIEGYAKPTETDRKGAALARANTVRNELLKNGVKAAQIEVVAADKTSARDGVRLVSAKAEAQAARPAPGSSGAASAGEPIGSALFVAPAPLSIKKDSSALVNMLSEKTRGEQVYYYDPVSTRGSKRFAFRAVRLDNPSQHTLESGPFTVYAAGQFLGEGLSEPIPPKSSAFIPFALDRQLLVEPVVDTREEIDRLVTIQRGIVTTEAQTIRRTKLSLSNRGDAVAKVWIRHAVPTGWKLRDSKVKVEKLRGTYLFPISVPPRAAIELEIEESQPLEKSVDINTDAGVDALALFLRRSKPLSAELQKQLDEIVRLHKEMSDTRERVSTLESQMSTYRERIDEIHAQLVTLRRVASADKLSRHLAKKMEEISERLQKSTIEVTDLKGKLMTGKVALSDRLAELTLVGEKPKLADQR
ncbi:MAG: DUF4139 domain-containing protein [Myxococcales bacterium]|nr:DUF4139 domain-containing protein [Myxococcales bacterium]